MTTTLLECFRVLTEEYFDTPLARHITLALSDYDNIEFLDDQTLLECLIQYIYTLELDGSIGRDNIENDYYGDEY